ncbi:uncharacterized protein MCYG_01264 [Microsporum canis CBS 113480]|uniref:Uncharacterized protein n=1 Tax=Arthroderma otae (strain ATCC MYA-4605 / CBS 113480) TaxID=554155 RepID=C5FEQ2_ARTOC|nr:uncharacterized protein MCYG_01264 [Microsporum canis CBS 113480]EEQ28376.1 predicted protein [Microsporum canis CBS 113480]
MAAYIIGWVWKTLVLPPLCMERPSLVAVYTQDNSTSALVLSMVAAGSSAGDDLAALNGSSLHTLLFLYLQIFVLAMKIAQLIPRITSYTATVNTAMLLRAF